MKFKIGTRGSRLALAQSRWVKEKIEGMYPELNVEIKVFKTTGDKILDSPLSKIGGKGLFVKEIEDALLRNEINVAVHSMKDVPVEIPGRLMFSSYPEREDPRDALISKGDLGLDQLPAGSRIGTSSLRRASQLLHLRSDLEIVSLRGNVETRIEKMASGHVQAVILAAAGLKRLGLSARITQFVSTDLLLPAIGQGALGLEVRRNDEWAINILDFLNHDETKVTVTAERAVLRKLEGGCQVPLAAFARLDGERLYLQAMVAEIDGTRVIKDEITGKKDQAEELGVALAGRLLKSGADKILDAVYLRDARNDGE
ncbi:MAG TPA: hydroxymethylbilane synthase [Desulfobacteraceae bacterium]|nr:hydroxymethylbilane synthase [Desulfobacteraceae bacterium]